MTGQRSKSYPNCSVLEAVKRIESLKQRSGISNSYDSATFATGIGYKDDNSGAFSRTAAALIQYNLIRKDGAGYSLTEVSRKMLIPQSNTDREEAMRQAALSPSLFATLYNDFMGQTLPEMFPNILVNKYGILDGAKNKVASIFRSTLESVGLMNGGHVVDEQRGYREDEQDTSNDENIQNEAPSASTTSPGVPSTTLTKDFGQGRKVVVTLPNDITDDERKKLTVLIENM